MATTIHYSSIGYAAQLLQATPQRIEAAARRAGVEAAEVRNGVRHYTDDQIELIRAELNAKKRAADRDKLVDPGRHDVT